MNITVTAHNFELTQALHTYTEQRVRDGLMRLLDDSATQVDITLAHQASAEPQTAQECRLHLSAPHLSQIVVIKAAGDMYQAIDMAQDTLLEQVRSTHKRTQDLHHVRKNAEKERAEIARSTLTTGGAE